MNKKKMITALTLGVLLVTMITGVTLAYLERSTETVQNTFSSTKSIAISLREPLWDGYTFDNVTDKEYPCGQVPMEDNATLGINRALKYVPGDSIPKNPTIKNTGTRQEPVYTAMKVRYYIWDGKVREHVSYETFAAKLLQEEGITFGSQYTLLSNQKNADQIYLYGSATDQATALAVGEDTGALFTNVPLSLEIEPKTDGSMPKFAIEVTGYAIQAANVDASEAGQLLIDFIQGQ